MNMDKLMTEDAQSAKLFVYFNQLSDAHKREILEKAERLVTLQQEDKDERRDGERHIDNS
jgi:hypothetical protein